MIDGGSGELRIGTEEREESIVALGEHMSAGRLDIEEYGDRSARVTTARTLAELQPLFTDLPQPHPRCLNPTVSVPATLQQPIPVRTEHHHKRKVQVAMGIAGALSLPAFFVLGMLLPGGFAWAWIVFLIPGAIAGIARSMYGEQDFPRRIEDGRRRRRGLY
ncbi:DUF1707 domain-containing protein [Pseudonocardiaceae bacterium YIM PH 21723]|nr:DUF1707 domain-containing protein [Pseudonocardiaceae bacterium YIM PH 21723]